MKDEAAGGTAFGSQDSGEIVYTIHGNVLTSNLRLTGRLRPTYTIPNTCTIALFQV